MEEKRKISPKKLRCCLYNLWKRSVKYRLKSYAGVANFLDKNIGL